MSQWGGWLWWTGGSHSGFGGHPWLWLGYGVLGWLGVGWQVGAGLVGCVGWMPVVQVGLLVGGLGCQQWPLKCQEVLGLP